MSPKILIAGPVGYGGGSVLSDFITSSNGLIKAENLIGLVRSDEQVKALASKGVNVLQLDATDEEALAKEVLENEDPAPLLSLIRALGKRHAATGQPTYFIQITGYPDAEVRDDDPLLFEKEKTAPPFFPRQANVVAIEEAKKLGVTSFVIAVPLAYGEGTGYWNELSFQLHSWPAAHISDLTVFYRLLVEKILSKAPIPSDEHGRYFAVAHRLDWWDILDQLASIMHKRGFVSEPKADVWPSEEAADTASKAPPGWAKIGLSNGTQAIPVKKDLLGWQPEWDQERFMESLEDEVRNALESDLSKSGIYKMINAVTWKTD
ncbi:NAD(P)-binding protein [Xylariaceae sp. FL1272]|nr:NAD(P)-binding protein [Xylariaceae sp. FL1272]